VSIDFKSPEFIKSPYPLYKQLREADSPYWLSREQKPDTPGIWLFSSYAHAVEIFRGSGPVSKRIIQDNTAAEQILLYENMLNQDPPDHARLRNTAAQYFSPKRIKE